MPEPTAEPQGESGAKMTKPTGQETPPVDEALAETEADFGETIYGGALTNQQAREITSARRTTVVVLAGGVGSGKTTLLTSLYGGFLQEPVGDRLFAGSQTLHGFERRAYYGRVESGLIHAATKTTHKLEHPWLHLRVREQPAELGQSQDLLFADLSGEWFEQLATGETPFTDFPYVFRADHFLLILDGAKLATPTARDKERSLIEQLARRLIESQALVSDEALGIVLTKWDALAKAGSTAQDYADNAVDRISTSAGLSKRLPHWRVAARPETADFPLGHGVPELFVEWVLCPARSKTHPAKIDSSTLPRNPFDRFNPTRPWPVP
jgi:energy-coupling factor transporter ATP-binding protein EcfA2